MTAVSAVADRIKQESGFLQDAIQEYLAARDELLEGTIVRPGRCVADLTSDQPSLAATH